MLLGDRCLGRNRELIFSLAQAYEHPYATVSLTIPESCRHYLDRGTTIDVSLHSNPRSAQAVATEFAKEQGQEFIAAEFAKYGDRPFRLASPPRRVVAARDAANNGTIMRGVEATK